MHDAKNELKRYFDVLLHFSFPKSIPQQLWDTRVVAWTLDTGVNRVWYFVVSPIQIIQEKSVRQLWEEATSSHKGLSVPEKFDSNVRVVASNVQMSFYLHFHQK